MTDGRKPLVLALPKGRTLKVVAPLLAKAGVTPAGDAPDLLAALDDKSRALVRKATFSGPPSAGWDGREAIDVLLLKPDDVPTYVEHGTADVGVCGRDILAEREVDVYQPVDLGVGRCRLVVAGRVGTSPEAVAARDGRMPRVATKYPRSTEAHFARRGVQVEVVNVQSSVELAPLTGLADLIVDLVETGATLAENGLEIKEEIASVSTLLIVNRASYKLRREVLGPLVEAIRAAVS